MSTLVLGDLHLDKKHNVSYGDASIWDNKSLDILTSLIAEHDVTELILLGDIFDTAKPPSLVFAKFVATIIDVETVFILAGNHDLPMVKQETAFAELDKLPNVLLIQPNNLYFKDDWVGIGWHDTQEDFEFTMHKVIGTDAKTIYVHASRADWGNKNDNVVTKDILDEAKKHGHHIVSGHEHTGFIGKGHTILGSVVPHTIGELGDRYYMLNGETIKLPEITDIVITREEPTVIEDDVVYAVRPKKEITLDDISMEEKDLTVDVLADFWNEAEKAGFTKELLND
jgi:DNA repair exonuclease SbcCD nuclease subunit